MYDIDARIAELEEEERFFLAAARETVSEFLMWMAMNASRQAAHLRRAREIVVQRKSPPA